MDEEEIDQKIYGWMDEIFLEDKSSIGDDYKYDNEFLVNIRYCQKIYRCCMARFKEKKKERKDKD